MDVHAFVAERSADWTELEALVERSRRPRALGGDGARRLGALYRAAAADLAFARRRFSGDPLVTRLEQLVRSANAAVYAHERPLHGIVAFFSHGYWRRVRERPVMLAVSALLLFGAAFLSGLWGWRDPAAAQRFSPSAYDAVTRPRDTTDLGLSSDQQAQVASGIMTNNIRVTVLAFAGGLLAGAGTILLLLYNGLELGVVGGLAIGAGNGRPFFELVTAHGVLELSCIVVAGAAGLRLGWAIIDPGFRPRREVVAEEARATIELVLGTAVWLVVAGLVEGFVTPRGLGLTTVLTVGGLLGAIFWGLVLWRGAPARVPEPVTAARTPWRAGTPEHTRH